MEKMKDKKVGATLGVHLSVRYDLRTKRRTCLHFIYFIKGFLFLFLFLFPFSFLVDRLFVIPLHSSSRNRGYFFILSFPFSFLQFLVDVRGLSMLVSSHHTTSLTHTPTEQGGLYTLHKKKDLQRIRQGNGVLLLFFHPFISLHGRLFFFFACLLIGWFVCLSLYGVDDCTYISILLLPFSPFFPFFTVLYMD